MQPYAKVICDSIAPNGARLTTLEVRLHRFVLAELNTHKLFSRSSASSRAIPIQKRIDEVRDHIAAPLYWGKNQKGMQADVEMSDEEKLQGMEVWEDARDAMIFYAKRLMKLGCHKQVANRLLEPFSWHTVVISSTEWDNFFWQRVSKLAQPEIMVPAKMMMEAREASKPVDLLYGKYHLPYMTADDKNAIDDLIDQADSREKMAMVSVGRSARTSYGTQADTREIEADLALYERLRTANPPHMAPFEHVARPKRKGEKRYGNFFGWMQLRRDVFGPYVPDHKRRAIERALADESLDSSYIKT